MGRPSGVVDNRGHECSRSSSFSSTSLLSISPKPKPSPSKRKNHKARCCLPSTFTMFLGVVVVLLTINLGRTAYLEQRQATATVKSDTSKVPDYFQTSPELFAGERPYSIISKCFSKLIPTVCSRSHCHWTSSLLSPNQSRTFWSTSIICSQHTTRDCPSYCRQCCK